MVEALNSINANYTASSGTVLAWYRDCSLAGNDDVDFSVDFTWFTNNLDKLNDTLVAAGWSQTAKYGKPGQIGYEEAWRKKGSMKFDLFYLAEVNFSVDFT